MTWPAISTHKTICLELSATGMFLWSLNSSLCIFLAACVGHQAGQTTSQMPSAIFGVCYYTFPCFLFLSVRPAFCFSKGFKSSPSPLHRLATQLKSSTGRSRPRQDTNIFHRARDFRLLCLLDSRMFFFAAREQPT